MALYAAEGTVLLKKRKCFFNYILCVWTGVCCLCLVEVREQLEKKGVVSLLKLFCGPLGSNSGGKAGLLAPSSSESSMAQNFMLGRI